MPRVETESSDAQLKDKPIAASTDGDWEIVEVYIIVCIEVYYLCSYSLLNHINTVRLGFRTSIALD
jgi:hypothetical protein